MKSSRVPTEDPEQKEKVSEQEKKWNKREKKGEEKAEQLKKDEVEDVWVEKFSETHKRKYWKNSQTGKSTWHDPKRPVTTSSSTSSASSSSNGRSNSKKKLELPDTSKPVDPPAPPPKPSRQTVQKKTDDLNPTKEKQQEEAPEPEKATSRTHLTVEQEEVAQSSKASKLNRFSGGVPLQYGLWGHYMSVGCSLLCLWFGIVAILWDTKTTFYECKIDGKLIDSDYILKGPEFGVLAGTCNVRYKGSYICCDPSKSSDLTGFEGLGYLYIIFSIVNYLYFENTSYGWGLFFPSSSLFFDKKISPWGIFLILFGICGLASYATVLPAVCLMATGIVYNIAARNQEVGDGGRARRKKMEESARAKRDQDVNPDFDTCSHRIREKCSSIVDSIKSANPVTLCRKAYNEDKIASYFWVGLFFALNIVLFFYTLAAWNVAVDDMKNGLLDGTLKVDDNCSSDECILNRHIIRGGPISDFGPWAKAAGACLNLDCSLILLPVIKMILSKLNDASANASRYSKSSNLITQFFNRPITRYIPLQKNIEFHKLCAFFVFFFAWFHTIFHCLNLMKSAETTLNNFAVFGWKGTDFLTGAIVCVAMFFIYSAAPNAVKHANFEIFFYNHHWFIVFFLMLFIHGPVFFYWSCVPVALYIVERYLQAQRGSKPFVVTRVEWIPPVMALQFKPLIKEDFVFKEGQYLYLNCPFISKSEWHPFTISSAADDLDNGPRVLLETGERVYEVPRPKDWPKGAKWNKYCVITKDYRKLSHEFLVDKCDTGYLDYVSLHIKVHGLDDPSSKSWTKKLKEYFEMMNPPKLDENGNIIEGSNFPFYFLKRDNRGDLQVGKQFGPDGSQVHIVWSRVMASHCCAWLQILRVDGPHSAPAQQYANYGTIMLIGAGIGLTPCVSILSSLLKYRWQKSFTPEIVHFYWVVRHNEVESFQWLVHALTELEYELHRQRSVGLVSNRYYCEINIFVTAYNPRDTRFVPKPLHKASTTLQQFTGCSDNSKSQGNLTVSPLFDAEELYDALVHPSVSSKEMKSVLKSPQTDETRFRFQDIRVWSGRPIWDDIFSSMKENREHPDIGVCFCGAPVIGADLKNMCEKYSSVQDECVFSLHKENF